MIQHHTCPYCGKPTDTGFNCGCPESKLTITYNYMTEIKPLYKQDLLSLARELPPMDGLDHEERILYHYSKTQWDGVDMYVDYVLRYRKIANQKPPQPLGEKIMQNTGKWLTDVISWLKTHSFYKYLYVFICTAIVLYIILN